MRNGLSSARLPAPRSRCSWAGCWRIVLLLLVCLTSWPISAQPGTPISRLGASDYLSFQADILTISLQLTASRSALERVLSENDSLRQRCSELEQIAMQHSSESTSSSAQDLQELEGLRRRLNESNALVRELRASLKSKQEEYDGKLKTAEAAARRIERQNTVLKIAVGVLAMAAAAGFTWAAMK